MRSIISGQARAEGWGSTMSRKDSGEYVHRYNLDRAHAINEYINKKKRTSVSRPRLWAWIRDATEVETRGQGRSRCAASVRVRVKDFV
jgi:hypothetical protein